MQLFLSMLSSIQPTPLSFLSAGQRTLPPSHLRLFSGAPQPQPHPVSFPHSVEQGPCSLLTQCKRLHHVPQWNRNMRGLAAPRRLPYHHACSQTRMFGMWQSRLWCSLVPFGSGPLDPSLHIILRPSYALSALLLYYPNTLIFLITSFMVFT